MPIDQAALTAERVATFTKSAATLRAFADRQEARGVDAGLIAKARDAADLAERAATAYAADDKATARGHREAMAAILADAMLAGIV
jgi:hypothetical protein